MSKELKRVADFDQEKIRTYIHLEGIPAFTMTREQKQYLLEYREAIIREQGGEGISTETIATAFRGMGPIASAQGLEEEVKKRREAFMSHSTKATNEVIAQAEAEMNNQSDEAKEAEQAEKTKKTTRKKTTKKSEEETISE